MLPGDGKFQPQLTQRECNRLHGVSVTISPISMRFYPANAWYLVAFVTFCQLNAAAAWIPKGCSPTNSVVRSGEMSLVDP